MEIKSKVLGIALVSLFLCTLFFGIATSGSGGNGYDPWVDYDESGKVDYMDLYNFARAYETSGDPTKNVNVTNFPLDEYGNLKVNVVPRGTLSLCHDAQRIVVIDTYEKGLSAKIDEPWGSGFWDNVYYSYFVFTPKPTFHNITRIIIQAVCASLPDAAFNISVGFGVSDAVLRQCWRRDANLGLPTSPSSWQFMFWIDEWWNQYLGPYPGYSGLQVLDSIKPGINVARMDATLSPSTTPCTIFTYRVELFIEYNYWDYVE